MLNRLLDHAVLKPDMTRDEVIAAIELGLEYDVKSVCVRPCDIELAKELCAKTTTEVSCVLAFPHGTAVAASKADEARVYVGWRVDEIDMVINYSLIRSGMWDAVADDMRAVTSIANPEGIGVKVILETCFLTIEQIERATRLAVEEGAKFVKTSTGFAGGGATVEAVTAMMRAAGNDISVKASGGIRDRETAAMYAEMGCARLGVGYSSTPIICGRYESGALTGSRDTPGTY